MDGIEVYQSKRNKLKERRKEKIDIIVNDEDSPHVLLDEVLKQAHKWGNGSVKEHDLIIQNMEEYICIMKFREMMKTQKQLLTKEITTQFDKVEKKQKKWKFRRLST